MGMSEKIKIILVKRGMSAADLAKRLGCTSVNIYNKLKKDNYTDKDLAKIADALDCDYEGIFTLRDTGEKV